MDSVHNVASSDAKLPEPPDKSLEANKDQDRAKTTSFSKRKRFNDKLPSFKRRGGASHLKLKPQTSLQIQPRRRSFPVFTSNHGCRELANICFDVIQGKDFRLAQNINRNQLAYVLTIAFCNRVVQCALRFGYAFPPNASRLKQVAAGIQLPDVLASYIESIGRITLLSGISVVPYIQDYEDICGHDQFLDPADFLLLEGRPLPGTDWQLDIDWIVSYNDATTRAARSGMNFRVVNNDALEGRLEMLVSYKRTADDMVLPECPQIMTEAEAQLGAVYRFRDYERVADWPGANRELLFNAFIAIPCDPRVVFSDLCVAAFKGMHVSTD